jgi:hypothetical protein
VSARPDLSERTGFSKSAFGTFEWCQQASWFDKHERRPVIPNPRMTFGSAVDAGVEVAIKYARIGKEPDFERMADAADAALVRDGIEVDMGEVIVALEDFTSAVLPSFDWSHAELQKHLTVTLGGIGEVDGHPDIILPGEVWDVKTSTRARETAKTVELGTYALMLEEDTGRPVTRVGYLTWVRRLRTPGWQVLDFAVDDEFRDWTRARWGGYVRANAADDLLNARGAALGMAPVNYSFPGGPINGDRCRTCQYSPALGGRCEMAVLEPLPGGNDE